MPKRRNNELTQKQKAFCELFASDKEFFGNGVQSYIETYSIDVSKKGTYNTARTQAYRLLTKPYIQKYIDALFESRGLNDQYVDKQLEKLITQDADFSNKLGAIREYNKLKSRVSDKVDITTKGESLNPVVRIIDERNTDSK